MNHQDSSSSQVIQKIHLQLRSEKFFETLLNERTFQICIIEGDLSQKDKLRENLKRSIERKTSLGEALQFVTDQINKKMDEGYEFISAEEQDLQKQENPFDQVKDKEEKQDKPQSQKEEANKINTNINVAQQQQQPEIKPVCRRSIAMSQKLWEFIDEIDQRAKELQVMYQPSFDSLLVTGYAPCLDQLSRFIEGISVAMKAKKEEEEKKLERENAQEKEQIGNFLQRQLIVCKFMRNHIKEIEAQAQKSNLIYENLDDIVLVAGPQKIVLDFFSWVYNMTSGLMQKEMDELKKVKIVEKDQTFFQEEWSISTFHRVKEAEIIQKAKQLEIICDFGYDVVLVSGYKDSLKDFRSYLHDVEAKAKKSLYPKYWDFHEVNMFSEIDVPEYSEEFQEVSQRFYRSLNNVTQITKVTRIQNKYLMDHYVTMLQKRQELRPNGEINRLWLFHGTKNVDPKTIYRNSDTGFDLQYSNPHGSYGKGLYFAIDANYPHGGYSYNCGNGRSQMFLADVFIGKPYKSQPNNKLLKAPEGYDSVEANNSFYIVYNNFHSYPLYLIEYTNNYNNGYNWMKPNPKPIKYPPFNNNYNNFRKGNNKDDDFDIGGLFG